MTAEAIDRVDVLVVDSGTGPRRVRLRDYLDATLETRSTASEYDWIKALRRLEVDGQPFRRRFTFRGDSLWWFAELYLHKQQVILGLFRTISALERLIERERPVNLRVAGTDRLLRGLAPQLARRHGVRYDGAAGFGRTRLRLLRMDLRARALAMAARASRARSARRVPTAESTRIAGFVHRAFWRSGGVEGSAESYIGPVLEALEQRRDFTVTYVGVGPAENFRARRWWHPLTPDRAKAAAIPIESLAPLAALRDSRRVWHDRHALRRALWSSSALRQHATIAGCDCWPVIREELAGIALLQWPWSARAMDEAGAALDVLQPAVALTYAEAGGWGRALMLEARRRGIPTAGLQHGFIYGSWLNYLHEPDETGPDAGNAADAGFPFPARTLVFDDYARMHLEERGRFPAGALCVTGNPRLDALVRAASALSEADLAAVRDSAGAGAGRTLVLLVAKYGQARHVLGALAGAVQAMPDVQLAIKAHPAETPDLYDPVVAGQSNVRVLPASAPLAALLRASRAIVTVNSSVALDAAVLGVPTLVIGLPNNLSPFVDAGIMAGAATTDAIGPQLHRILYDEGFRLQIERAREAYLAEFGIASDGGAAARSADAVLALIRQVKPMTGDGRKD
jgi:hypothetical protein